MTEDPADPRLTQDEDHVWSSVDTTRNDDALDYHWMPEEKQVLLLPQFCFMVVDKEKDPYQNQIIIKIIQLPY